MFSFVCETNPISGGPDTPPFQCSTPVPIVQNKAKLGQDGTSGGTAPWGGVSGARQTRFRSVRSGAGGQLRKTNPISGGRDTPVFQYSTIPPFRSRANHAKQSQSEKGSEVSDPTPRNTPGLPRTCRKGNPAKQSQFGLPGGEGVRAGRPTGAVTPEPNCAKQTQLPWSGWKRQVLGRKGVMMSLTRAEPWQNKANFEQPDRDPEAKLRKTKPNLGRMGHLGDGASGRPIVRNKPNFGGSGRESGVRCAKQSQFAPASNSCRGIGGASPTLHGRRRAGRTSHEEPIMQNKANFGEPSCGGISQHSSIPSFQYSSGRLSCETKPICPGAAFHRSCLTINIDSGT